MPVWMIGLLTFVVEIMALGYITDRWVNRLVVEVQDGVTHPTTGKPQTLVRVGPGTYEWMDVV
jgi:hypothetical protein